MKILSTLFLCLISSVSLGISSCKTNSSSTKATGSTSAPTIIQHSYEEINHLKIDWQDIFTQKEAIYYVYFYSTSCHHCSSIKNKMIECALGESKRVYFVEDSKNDIYGKDELKTIGCDNIENFFIIGRPALVLLEKNIVTKHIIGTDNILKEINN